MAAALALTWGGWAWPAHSQNGPVFTASFVQWLAVGTKAALAAANCIMAPGMQFNYIASSPGFVGGCALPIGKTGGGCDEQARARCCVGAAVGFAAARRTLRWIFKLLAACLALFLFFCCCCRRGCVDASASCAATQALQRRHTGARCRAKCVCCCCRRCCCYCCCYCCFQHRHIGARCRAKT